MEHHNPKQKDEHIQPLEQTGCAPARPRENARKFQSGTLV